MFAITEIDPKTMAIVVLFLVQLGVFGAVIRAGEAKNQLATLLRLVSELSSTVATLSITVAKGEVNDSHYAMQMHDLSTRLTRIEGELRTGPRAGAIS